MPFVALLLLIAALLPLASCLTLLGAGRKLGTPLAGYVATFSIAVSFICSGWAMMRWVSGGKFQGAQYGQNVAPITQTWGWIPVGTARQPNGVEQDHPGFLDVSLFIDSLTVTLFLAITTVAMLVHIFAARSMRRDLRFVRFFTLLSLACFSILGLLLCGSLLQMALMLELVGLVASMLIGFRTEREPTRRAAAKIFIVNRVADIGLLLGMGMLVALVGNLTLPDLWMMLGGGGATGAATVSVPTSTLTTIGVLLLLGAAARCAQFPLHVWAGDAAEGVAPAATMVFVLTLGLGGVYFIARIFPLLTPSARLLGAILGSTTLVMAALIGCVQPGIKQVLAWASVAQLGLVVLAICIASWPAAMLHLTTYVFFQAALFLAAGAVIRAARGETGLSQFGGLWRRMPVTAATSLVAILAACGAGVAGIGLGGYYSRGLILRHTAALAGLATAAGRSHFYWALFILPVAGTVLLSFLLVRWWLLVFAGSPRDRRLFDHAREVSTLFWPLVVLSVMTALTGRWLSLGDLVEGAVVEAQQQARMQADASPAYHGAVIHVFDWVWTADETPSEGFSGEVAPASLAKVAERAEVLGGRWLWIAVLLGFGSACAIYARGPRLTERLTRIPPINWLHAWLRHRMFFDELYDALFVQMVVALAGVVAGGDRKLRRAMTGLPSRIFRNPSRPDRRSGDAPVRVADPQTGQPS